MTREKFATFSEEKKVNILTIFLLHTLTASTWHLESPGLHLGWKSFTDVSKEYYYSLFWVLPALSLSSKLECCMQIPLKEIIKT